MCRPYFLPAGVDGRGALMKEFRAARIPAKPSERQKPASAVKKGTTSGNSLKVLPQSPDL
jgi:hypothetical protein